MVIRPTSGNSQVPNSELEYILQTMGFEFATSEQDDILSSIDSGNRGYFY